MKFKVGQRVAVGAVDYYQNKRMDGKGTITLVQNLIEVEMDRWDPPGKSLFHPKQCRLLKKKERRRVWVNYEACRIGTLTQVFAKPPPSDLYDYVEFIEVRAKDRTGEQSEQVKRK